MPYGNIASILQGAGQRGQPPDIQQALANMRLQLYGMPQQGSPSGNGLQVDPGFAGRQIGGGATQPQHPMPAWQQLAQMGIGGQGSAAGNRAALQAAQGGQSFGGGLPTAGVTPDQNNQLPPELLNAKPMPFPEFDPNNQQGNNQGPPVGMDFTGRSFGPAPVPITGGGLQPPLAPAPNGGAPPAPAPGIYGAGELPATMTAPPVQTSVTKPTLQPATAPQSQAPVRQAIMQPRMPAQQRIAQARQGIRAGVQQALRRPAPAAVVRPGGRK
jgi:hypothetical protein